MRSRTPHAAEPLTRPSSSPGTVCSASTALPQQCPWEGLQLAWVSARGFQQKLLYKRLSYCDGSAPPPVMPAPQRPSWCYSQCTDASLTSHQHETEEQGVGKIQRTEEKSWKCDSMNKELGRRILSRSTENILRERK